MRKMIILGAGATAGCSVVKKNLKPPLLRDIPAILSRYLHSVDKNNQFRIRNAQGFDDILRITGLRNDIERLFTIMHLLEMVFIKNNYKYILPNDNEIDDLIKSPSLRAIFETDVDFFRAKAILTYYKSRQNTLELIAPLNLRLTFFRDFMKESIYQSLNSFVCRYHSKLFNTLNENDIVVNFNYDELADHTLSSMGKLGPESLEDLGFSKIDLPKSLSNNSCSTIKYIKLHGSFNWTTHINDFSIVNYEYNHQGGLLYGNIFFPPIMPSMTKDAIYNQYAILANHLSQFEKHLRELDSLIIVGKSMQNSDMKLNDMIIRNRKYKQCDLILIDPGVKNRYFIEEIEFLFNGTCSQFYPSLAVYYKS